MLSGVKFSLYEILGYVFPGVLVLAGIVVGVSWIKPVEINYISELNQTILLLFTAYIVGHFVQGVSNFLTKKQSSPSEFICKYHPNIVVTVIRKLKDEYSIEIGKEDLVNIYDLCLPVIVSSEVNHELEVYTYREGFYRGMSLSALFVSLVSLSNVWLNGSIILVQTTSKFEINSQYFGALFIVLFFMSIIFYNRYLRFVSYRVKTVIYGFVMLKGEGKNG